MGVRRRRSRIDGAVIRKQVLSHHACRPSAYWKLPQNKLCIVLSSTRSTRARRPTPLPPFRPKCRSIPYFSFPKECGHTVWGSATTLLDLIHCLGSLAGFYDGFFGRSHHRPRPAVGPTVGGEELRPRLPPLSSDGA